MSNFFLIKEGPPSVSKDAEWFHRPDIVWLSSIFLDNRNEHGPENSVYLSL